MVFTPTTVNIVCSVINVLAERRPRYIQIPAIDFEKILQDFLACLGEFITQQNYNFLVNDTKLISVIISTIYESILESLKQITKQTSAFGSI